MTLNYSTPVAQVRLLINDTNVSDHVFADGEINAFLALEGGSVKMAAAQALDTIADDEVLTSKVITSQDLSTDGAAVAAQLRERAKDLRAQGRGDASGALTPRGSFPCAPDDKPWR